MLTAMSDSDAVLGGTGRNASTLELFFDLVYVFAITQVVSLIHADPTVIADHERMRQACQHLHNAQTQVDQLYHRWHELEGKE